MTDPLEPAQLSHLLPPDESSEAEEHLDLPSLAAYLDRALPPEEVTRVEEHLASCPSCRDLATEAAGALAPPEPIPLQPPHTPISSSPNRTRTWPSRALAAAAVFLVALFAAWFLLQEPESLDPRLEALGVDARTFARAPESVQMASLQTLDGTWPAPETFAGLTEDTSSSTMRNVAGMPPRPVAPRWTRIRDHRPVLLWYPARSEAGAEPREEILLVDEDEQLVAILSPETASSEHGETLRRAALPQDLPPLEPGRIYAWKVNSRAGHERLDSSFVPFRVLPVEDAEEIDRALAQAGGDPVLTGLFLAQHGLYAEALTQLSSARGNGAADEIREDLLRSCLEHTINDPALLEQELRRLTGAGSP